MPQTVRVVNAGGAVIHRVDKSRTDLANASAAMSFCGRTFPRRITSDMPMSDLHAAVKAYADGTDTWSTPWLCTPCHFEEVVALT